MEESVKYARRSFWKKLIFAVLPFEGYFGNYEKLMRFLEKAIFGKIVADFQSFKMT